MFSSIYLKTLYNLRFQLLGWSLGVGFVAFITMVFYNSFNQSGIESIINSVPESLKPLVGSVDDFKTVSGYIGQQIFGPNGYILAVAASLLLAFSVSANEEDDGRLQTLLTLPVTRSAVFCQKWLAVMTAVAVICIAVVVSTYLGLLVVGHGTDFSRMMQSTLAFFLMNGAFATIAFSIAMFTGKKGLSIAIAAGYTAVSFIISSLAMSVDQLKEVDKLSVLHYYNNPLVMQHGLKLEHVLILAGIIVIVATIGWLRFKRRNVGV
jgi:ABC-2 type transport system permease protein